MGGECGRVRVGVRAGVRAGVRVSVRAHSAES